MTFKMIHENYNVTDLQKSIAFYQEAFGLTETRRIAPSDGSFIIVFLGNDKSSFELELTWLKEKEGTYNLGDGEFHLAFEAPDFEVAHEKHKNMGCIVYENTQMGIYFVTDPDGYWLEVVPAK
ncbi:lactoylglutathione lyase [Clostridia bacterium]|nr:lactoylglutathione lyase [Clostridia bacterium]